MSKNAHKSDTKITLSQKFPNHRQAHSSLFGVCMCHAFAIGSNMVPFCQATLHILQRLKYDITISSAHFLHGTWKLCTQFSSVFWLGPADTAYVRVEGDELGLLSVISAGFSTAEEHWPGIDNWSNLDIFQAFRSLRRCMGLRGGHKLLSTNKLQSSTFHIQNPQFLPLQHP